MNKLNVALGSALVAITINTTFGSDAISSEGDLYCYIEVADGQLINLEHLCGAGTVLPSQDTSIPESLPPESSPPESGTNTAFITACVSSAEVDPTISVEQAMATCSCMLRGYESTFASDEIAQITEAFANVNNPDYEPPAVLLEEEYFDIAFNCFFSGGITF